jgi:hypothetical protein
MQEGEAIIVFRRDILHFKSNWTITAKGLYGTKFDQDDQVVFEATGP